MLTALRSVRESGEVRGIKDVRVIADATQAAVFFTMDTVVGPVPTAQLFTVDAGKIVSIRMLFDPRPFIPPS